MKFSPDGKYILISTRTNLMMLVDSFKGTLMAEMNQYQNKNNEDIVGSFTPNGHYIACGSSNGDLHFWNKEQVMSDFKAKTEGKKINVDNPKVAVWKGHPRTVQYFQWNPRYLMAVSAAQNVSLWLPRSVDGAAGMGLQPKKSCLRKRNHNTNTNSSNHNK